MPTVYSIAVVAIPREREALGGACPGMGDGRSVPTGVWWRGAGLGRKRNTVRLACRR